MKINIANPTTGCQKILDIEDDKKLRIFYDKRMSQEVDASSLGDNFKGYVLRITGGSDKQGFGMKQGIISNNRIRVLLPGKTTCFLHPTHDGERKRRTVRGCVCGPDLAVINTIIVKKGPQEIEGLTDKTISRRLGPKRASKIRKLFNLSKEDDVRKYVVRRTVTLKNPKEGKKKTRSKAPKIQRLVTSVTIQRKKHRLAEKKKHFQEQTKEREEYFKMLKERRLAAKKKAKEDKAKIREKKKKVMAEKAKNKKQEVLKQIAKRFEYIAKAQARCVHKKLTRKQRKLARRQRKSLTRTRKITLKLLINMREGVKKQLKEARERFAKDKNKDVLRQIRRMKREAHELYLRIMSGARLPNLKKQTRLLKKEKLRKAKQLELKIEKHNHHERLQRLKKLNRKPKKQVSTKQKIKKTTKQPPAKKQKTD